jgi:hypothetical protein
MIFPHPGFLRTPLPGFERRKSATSSKVENVSGRLLPPLCTASGRSDSMHYQHCRQSMMESPF